MFGCASLPRMSYIDIYSSLSAQRPDLLRLISVRITKDTEEFIEDGLCTVGLHPNDVDDDWRDAFDIVEELAGDDIVVGVGVCGLDRSCEAPWLLQVDAFSTLADLSERVSKPFLVRCSKAHDELLHMHKNTDPVQPWIVTEFVKGQELARQMLDAGMHLSFGAAVMKDTPTLIEVVKLCPNDRLHLETGTQSEVDIAAITKRVAELRGVETDALCAVLQSNFDAVFKR